MAWERRGGRTPRTLEGVESCNGGHVRCFVVFGLLLIVSVGGVVILGAWERRSTFVNVF